MADRRGCSLDLEYSSSVNNSIGPAHRRSDNSLFAENGNCLGFVAPGNNTNGVPGFDLGPLFARVGKFGFRSSLEGSDSYFRDRDRCTRKSFEDFGNDASVRWL